MTKKRILITGGAGFIGYHLSNTLSIEPTNHVVIVDNFTRGTTDRDLQSLTKKSNVQLLSADLADKATYDKLGQGYDEIYHLAGIIGVKNVIDHPTRVLSINAIATLNLLDWCVNGGGNKLIFSSTSEVYAWTQQFHPLPVPTPENVPVAITDHKNPRSSYAGSKIFCELAVTQYCQAHTIPFVIVRYHNVYGPRMGYDHVIPQIYQRACQKENPLSVYSAEHSRAFCFINDAVSASISAMSEKSAENQIINIGNDLEEITMGKLAKLILKKANIQASTENIVNNNDPICRRCPDISQAKNLLGYTPQIDLDEGLEKTLTWYSKHPTKST